MKDNLIMPKVDVYSPLLPPPAVQQESKLSRITNAVSQHYSTIKNSPDMSTPRLLFKGCIAGATLGVTAGTLGALIVSLGCAITKNTVNTIGDNLVNGVVGGSLLMSTLGTIGGCIEAYRQPPTSSQNQ